MVYFYYDRMDSYGDVKRKHGKWLELACYQRGFPV